MDELMQAYKEFIDVPEEEVSTADRAILAILMSYIKSQKEIQHKQACIFSGVFQSLGRELGIEEEVLNKIYLNAHNYVEDNWDKIKEKIDQDIEFATIIVGLNEGTDDDEGIDNKE